MRSYLADGVNCLKPNIRALKQSMVSDVVIKSDEGPYDYDKKNPNPTGIFLGTDDNWYKISVKRYFGNCYSFALGILYDAPDNGYYIPGFTCGWYPTSLDEVCPLIIRDLKNLGREVHKVIYEENIPEKLPKASPDTYWIKIMFKSMNLGGFHVARLDNISGRWVHMMGWDSPPKVYMRNLQFGEGIEDNFRAMNMIKSLKITPDEFKKMYQKYYRMPWLPMVTRSTYETRDNASYFAYDPVRNPDSFMEYKPYAVMRID